MYKRMEINKTVCTDLVDEGICVRGIVCECDRKKACCSVICLWYPWGGGIAALDYLQVLASTREQ